MAWDIESHDLCLKISPMAVQRKSFNLPGRRLYFLQSKCLFGVAINAGNAVYCNDIRELSRKPLDSSYYSISNCQSEVQDGAAKRWRNGILLEPLEEIMQMLGYDYDSLVNDCRALVDSKLKELGPLAGDIRRVRQILFGDYSVAETKRKHWYCERLFKIEANKSTGERVWILRDDPAPVDSLRSILYRIYLTKTKSTDIHSRVENIPEQY